MNITQRNQFVLIGIGCLLSIFLLAKQLSPFNNRFFLVHDNTQASRIQEFAFNIQNGHIPPRIAPHYSYNMGHAVFNFYAPSGYWLGSFFYLMGVPSETVVKLLFLISLIGSFISMFLLLAQFVPLWGSFLGASVYSTSLWFAVEIFVRGNVGEVLFMALFPLSLYFLKKSSINKSKLLFLASVIVCIFTLSVHNVLSVIALPFLLFYSLMLTSRKKTILILCIAFVINAYFYLPAFTEQHLTYAKELAIKTNYSDHFLCPWQLWKAGAWSFGGSGNTCVNDDMSFQIGKPHLILGLLGLIVFFVSKKRRKDLLNRPPLLILVFSLFALFMTTYYSFPIWNALSPFIAVFQFPWRFISFGLFGVAFFSSYIGTIKHRIISLSIIGLSLFLFITSSKFFVKPWLFSGAEYKEMFLSKKYIQQKAAYDIAEYFPKTGNYAYWRTLTSFTPDLSSLTPISVHPFSKKYRARQSRVLLPIHYFPYWEIKIDNILLQPSLFDTLGRPIVQVKRGQIVEIQYRQTKIEMIANYVSIVGILFLFFCMFYKPIWKQINTKH